MAIKNNFPTIRPSLNLDFANSKQVDPRISFTRASTATYWDDKGVLQTAASGMPRIDHDPVTGECKGLLIEEQRTNLLLRSQEFDDAAWTKRGAALVTPNDSIAPDGSLTADRLSGLGLAGNDLYNANYTSTVIAASGSPYTPSIYIKRISTSGTVVIQNPFTDTLGRWDVDLSALPDGWVRITASTTGVTVVKPFVTSGTGAGGMQIRSSSASPALSLFIWGAQLEAGSFPTSYIPTTTAQVTRAADAASMTGTNFSSWYRQDEGTVYIEHSKEYAGTSICYAITDGTFTNLTQLLLYPTETRFGVIVGNALIIDFAAPSTYPQVLRSAFAVKSGDSARALNNQPLLTSAAIGTPVVSRMDIGNRLGLYQINGHIKKLAYYPKRLTNTGLQALTA